MISFALTKLKKIETHERHLVATNPNAKTNSFFNGILFAIVFGNHKSNIYHVVLTNEWSLCQRSDFQFRFFQIGVTHVDANFVDEKSLGEKKLIGDKITR